MKKKIKRIDIKEFREKGFLQELNRQFLHPLGLALEVNKDDDGNETLGGVWDYRDDPEGIIFDLTKDDSEVEYLKEELYTDTIIKEIKTKLSDEQIRIVKNFLFIFE